VRRVRFAFHRSLIRVTLIGAALVLCAASAFAGSKLSQQQRQEILRAFLDEHPYARRSLPRGETAAVIDGSQITPSEADANKLVERNGAAAKSGQRVLITGIRFTADGILLDINGGRNGGKKWSDRIKVGTGSPNMQPSDPKEKREDLGSCVLVKVNEPASITTERLQSLLAPVLDFRSQTDAEALQSVLPPALASAVKEHRALVGMDRDLVLAALGRPQRRLRESSDGQQYEEWIYGAPPQPVQFIRFVQGKVVRIEEIKVSGEKLVRTEDELGTVANASAPNGSGKSESAANQSTAGQSASAEHKRPPTLLRPEDLNTPSVGEPAAMPPSISVPQTKAPAK
jgi:hypothetical protein